MRTDAMKLTGLALLLWFCATLSIGLQYWVGDTTIYSKELEARREAFHTGILTNQPPGGERWGASGGVTTQKRVGVVFLAEWLHKASGVAVGKVYKAIDTLFLCTAMLALFFFLRRWHSPTNSMIGLLFFAVMLPFTYFFQLFHPWDRLQLTIWVGLFWLCIERRFAWLLLALPASMIVKYDTLVLPLFYFLLHWQHGSRGKALVEAGALCLVAIAANTVLDLSFPAPNDKTVFNPLGAVGMLVENAGTFARMGLYFPPLVVFTVPLILAFMQWRAHPSEIRAMLLFGLFLLATFVAFSRFEEVRAEMVVLVLLLPAALGPLSGLLETKPESRRPL